MSYDRSSYVTERGNVCCSLWWKICDNSFGDWWRPGRHWAPPVFEKRQPGHLASIASQVSASGAGTLCTFACRAKSRDLTLRMHYIYARALYKDDGASLDDLREAVTTLEDVARTTRRILGGAHPLTTEIETSLRQAQAALRARETP